MTIQKHLLRGSLGSSVGGVCAAVLEVVHTQTYTQARTAPHVFHSTFLAVCVLVDLLQMCSDDSVRIFQDVLGC